MKNKVYVLGGSQTDFSRNWSKEGKNSIAMLKEVVFEALDKTNISFGDIEKLKSKNRIGVFLGNFCGEYYINQGHLGALVSMIHPIFNGIPSARYEAACASGSVALEAGISKIKSGDYDISIVVGFEMMKTVDSKLCGDYLGRAAYYEKEGENIDFPFPTLFGKLAEETISKYSLDKKRYLNSLAIISNLNYSNAKRNPNAQTRQWFMNLQEANYRGSTYNPLVGTGILATSDCSQITDGAAVIILCSKRFIDEKNIKRKDYAIVKGYSHRNAPFLFEDKIEESKNNPYILPWTRQAVIDAYEMSNLSFDQIDFFETHDCFTSSEYAALSCFGFTDPGFEYLAVEKGDIFFDGKKPVNPSGGLIGCGHPVGASGVRMFLDLYKQICGKAGDYQIKHHKNGLMLNLGGSATTNYVFILGK